MKSLLLVLAISALIINQSYKKKATKAYFDDQPQGERDATQPDKSYSPFASFTLKSEHDQRLIKNDVLTAEAPPNNMVSYASYAIRRY